MKPFLYTLLIAVIALSLPLQSQTIRIGYPEFKPYTYTEQGEPRGIGIETMSAIAEQLQLTPEFIGVQTYGNAFTWLQKDKLDLVVLASQNSSRDNIAHFSQPIINNAWSWFFIKTPQRDYQEAVKDRTIRVATYLNANTHHWLLKKGYQSIAATVDLAAMIRQIKKQRIDAIFISEQVMREQLSRSETSIEAFYILPQLQKPFGVYVSHDYAKRYPRFLQKLNHAIATKL